MLKAIKALLLFLFLFIILLFSILFSGIKINSFSFSNLFVSQFYIKLDKKLIVKVDKIEFTSKKSEVKSSIEDLKKNIELLPSIINFFQEVDIKNLKIDGNEFSIFIDNDDLYLVAKGDIITDNVDKQENKIYIIVDVDNVRVETETISNTHNNTYYDVNIFVGSNDYSITKEEFNFFYNEIIKIFSEQSFNIDYNNKNLDVFTVDKPRYRSSVKTENDRIGYIILRFSHFYSNKIRI